MNSLRSRYYVILLFVLVLCYAWAVLVVGNGDLLYTIQDFSPWLGTREYLLQSLSHPGGLREWIGDFLTQLFYYPWLGGSVMVLMWAVSAFSLVRACRLEHGFQLLALLPVLALLTGITQLGYWVFCLKTVSYWFGPTVGMLVLSLFAWAYSRASHLGRCILLALWALLGFPSLGWFATLGFGVMLLLTPWRQSGRQWAQLLITAVVLGMLVLSYFSSSIGTHWRLPLLWYGFPHVVIPEASSRLLDVAPLVMTFSLLALPLIGRLQRSSVVQHAGMLSSIIVLAAGIYGANMLNYRNSNFHTELRMMRAMDGGDWSQVLQLMKESDRKPTRQMVLMKDVALAQTGRLHQSAFAYDVRGVRPSMVFGLPIHMVHSAAPTMYYWLGLPNYAYMWCMENYIEYGLSPHWLRLFYRSAVVNGELEVARKYKTLLQTTLFHKDLEVSTEECQAVRRFVTGHNVLDNDGGFSEVFLMRHLCQEEYDTAVGQEIALHYAMLMRNGEAFMKALDRYVELRADDAADLPIYYQEALLLFVSLASDDDPAALADLPVSQQTRDRFDRYRQDISLDMATPVLSSKLGDRYYARYGHTYWWYYDFYTDNKSY